MYLIPLDRRMVYDRDSWNYLALNLRRDYASFWNTEFLNVVWKEIVGTNKKPPCTQNQMRAAGNLMQLSKALILL